MAKPVEEQATLAASTNVNDLATRFLNKAFGRSEASRFTKINRPWESWQLNDKFFKALSQWTLDHPETSLERAFYHIRDGLEHSKDLLSLIPESPFPARGLVTALAYLFELGVKISRAQKDVYDFAKDVIRWVGEVKSAFETSENGRLTWSAWRDLKHMRKLLDEICSWAVERLNDGRWTRVGHGLKIQREIQEFNERISNARALFQDLSAINMAKGLDLILADLRRLLTGQRIIVNEIKMIRKTQEMQLAEIRDEKQKLAAERDRFLAGALTGHIVCDPTYDKQERRPCDPDTRVEVLPEINSWIRNVSPGTENFLWLTGEPGCGKSAVTASIAQECKRQNILWAQFFINRNIVETTDPNSYFPSIASQLATNSSEVAEALQTVLVKDRTLTDTISAAQAAKLFINSVQCASRLDTEKPVVVIIDGLDETDRRRLEDTAIIFSTLFTALRTYSNVKVFISSRTENEIQRSFVHPSEDQHVKRVHLNTSHPSSIQDVSQYIKRNLGDLVKKHDLNWEVWPGDQRAKALGQRASGLFIWGVTAIKFIEERLYSDGKECLNEVLDMLTAEVLDDINALYALILMVAHGRHQTEWEWERFRRIVGAIVCLQEPLCLDDLVILLDLCKDRYSEPVDIVHFVRRFRTILVIGTDAIDGRTIPRIHKSVFEFLTSNSVDAKFRVEPDHAHLELGMQCLVCLGTAQRLNTEGELPMPFRYASRFWSSHLSRAKVHGSTILCADSRRSPSATALSPFGFTGIAPFVGKPTMIRYSLPTSEITVAFNLPVTWDAVSGAHKYHGYRYYERDVTGITFSPSGNDIVSCLDDRTIKIVKMTNDGEIRTLVKHSSTLDVIAFAPDGKSIATGTGDGLIHIWDYSTGAPIGRPLRGHKSQVRCIAFSPDGKKIVSGSNDETCILWNARNGRAIGRPWAGHDESVICVAFSSSNRRVCSADYGGNCTIWDVSTGRRIRDWGYSGNSRCLSFSPTDHNVIAVGGDAIEIRSNNQNWIIPDSEGTRWLSFLPDGKQIIFSTSNTISVAEVGKDESTARIVRKAYFPSDSVLSPAFSPKFDYFVYVDNRHAIHLFSLHHTKTSLKVIPIDSWTRTKLAPNMDGAKGLKHALSNMKIQQTHGTLQATNRRLREITWYKGDSVVAATESALQVYVVTEDAVIAGYRNGSVSVWDQRGVDEDKKSSSMVGP